MTDTPVRERVAIEIGFQIGRKTKLSGEVTPKALREIADAVLDALTEPSEAMINAGWDVMPGYEPEHEDARETWQAMLRAAKEER